MAEGVSIKVNIAGKEYPIKVSASEHQTVMEIEQEINDRLTELTANYGVKDKQDLLAMFLFQYMMAQKNSTSNNNSESNKGLVDEHLYEKLEDLESFVSKYLKS